MTSYDDYDDDDLFEDHEPASPLKDSESLLRRAVDIIATARTMPLSSSPMINREEYRALEEAVHGMPDELARPGGCSRAATSSTSPSGRPRTSSTRAQAERMVRAPRSSGGGDAGPQDRRGGRDEARRMKLEIELLDQRLASFEILLERP